MLEYRQALRTKGGSKIAANIDEYVKDKTHLDPKTMAFLDRKTIENWLNDPKHAPSPRTLTIAAQFFQTAHFQQVVPKAKDYLGQG